MQLFSYVLILFIIIFMIKLVYNLKINKISFKKFVTLGIFCILVVFALMTNLLSYFSRFFGVGRASDFAVYASILFLAYISFKLYLTIETQRQQITTLVRNVAIFNAEHKYMKPKVKNKYKVKTNKYKTI